MSSKSIAVLGTACLLAAVGCGGGAQTDKPVATTTTLGTTTSPSGEAADARGTSQVRLVSALPATQRIDLSSENGVVFSAVPYKTVTPYKELTDNAAKFSIRSAGASNESLADNNEAMADGHRYTLVALPEEKGKGAQLKAFRDEVVPESGKAKVRVIHAAPNFGEVDVQLAGQKDAIFEDIDFGHEGGYKEIDPQSGTLQIRRDGGENAKAAKVVDAGRMQFEAGKAYTLVVAGANPARPDIIKFVDEPMGGQTTNAANATDDATRRGDTAASGTRQTSSNTLPPARNTDTTTSVKRGAMGGESDEAGTPRRKPTKEPS
ncbi:MAG TPA: DUF4397 domain-containing protein [Gemmatimonadales bacterium]|nr:DUF4397 domain-containing protein [Gemmatimonadales bacterium]